MLVSVQLAFAMVVMCGTAQSQCYTDPITGQRFCPRPNGNFPPSAVPSRQVIVDPNANAGSTSVGSSAHCRIDVGDGTRGSGTLVDCDRSTGLVLTCAHLFGNCESRIVVTFANGERFGGRLVDVDRANDLAALAIRRPGVEPLDVDGSEPTGKLRACGFGPNGVFRCVEGRIIGHPTAVGATHPATTIAGAVRPGDSGGGVLNAHGKLVGVVWGQRDGQTYATCGRPVCEFLNRLRSRIFADRDAVNNRQPLSHPSPASSPQFDWQTWTSELDARIRGLDAKKQDKGNYLQSGDLNGYLRAEDAAKMTGKLAPRSEVESKLGALAARFESVRSVVESVRERAEQIETDRRGFVRGMSFGKIAAGALGLSGPLAVALVVAGGLAGRGVRSRLRKLESRLPSRNAETVAIAVDSPPPPQRSVPETHYVPVEKDSFAKAHQWASEHVARKYPGATEVLQAQDSLIKQFLSAH
jgi:hypothetical protein